MNILVKAQGINNVKTHKSFATSLPVVCYRHTSKHARPLVALHTCKVASARPQCDWSRTTTAMMFSLQSLSLSLFVSHCWYNKNDLTTTTTRRLKLPQCALLVSQIRCQVPCKGIAAWVPVTSLERRRCMTLQVPEFLCGVKAAVAYIWRLISVYCWGSERVKLYFYSHICLYGVDKENCTFFVYQPFCAIFPLLTTSACKR